jgi:hypothetical protein
MKVIDINELTFLHKNIIHPKKLNIKEVQIIFKNSY